MKKQDIVKGGLYTAKVNDRVVVVRVKDIRETTTPSGRASTAWDVENTLTGRWTTFRSAAKFRGPAPAPSGKPRVSPHAVAPAPEPAPETDSFKTSADALQPGEAAELMAPELTAARSQAAEASEPALLCPECGSEDVVEHVSSASCRDCGETFALVDARRKPAPAPKTEAELGPSPCECGGRFYEEDVDGLCRACGGMPPADTMRSTKAVAPNIGINDSGRMATPLPATAGRMTSGNPSSTNLPKQTPLITIPKSVTSPAPKPANGVGLAATLAARKAAAETGSPHIVVVARAGSGKTTTIVEGTAALRGLPTKITPSAQQRAIWDAMALSKDARTIGMVCFNKSIANVLQAKLAERGLAALGCQAMTLHSLGNRAVGSSFGWLKVNEYRVRDVIAEVTETPIRELWRKSPTLIQATEKLVSLCKMNLAGTVPEVSARYGAGTHVTTVTDDDLAALAAHYDVELNGTRREVFALVPQVLEWCLDVQRDKCIDFDDMVWLPVVLGLPVTRFDMLLVDESQDLNRCQQALAKRAGDRLVFVGDDKQAIYGFAGADAESIERLKRELAETPRGCVVLPLTMTRRCGKAIVEEARQIVSDFEAHESNPAGEVARAPYTERKEQGHTVKVPWEKSYCPLVGPGDLVLCRVNAPLVSQCFQFLRRNIRAQIQGRDVGAGLVKLVRKAEASSVPELIEWLGHWLEQETEAENRKKNPSESRLIALQDKHDCVVCFTEDARSVEDVVRRIEDLFTDERGGPAVKFSSVHKAKGMEADRVFLLEPPGACIPHPMAKGEWQVEQEWNIRYVAVTRAVHKLTYVG